MTPKAQREALCSVIPNWTVHHGGRYCAITNCPDGPLKGRLFDPLEDLNAVHEAEKVLFGIQAENYARSLAGVGLLFYPVAHADADIRVECLLRTLNLWRD